MLVVDDLFCVDVGSLSVQNCNWQKPNCKGISPTPRYAHTATTWDKKLVIFGGFNGNRYLDDVYILDTRGLFWQRASTFKSDNVGPIARYAHSANIIAEKYLCIFGGCGESSVYNDILILDLASMTWQNPISPSGTLPSARAYHGSCVCYLPSVNQSKAPCLLVFGGRAGNKYFSDLFAFDSESLSWQKIVTSGSAPSPRAYHTCAQISIGSKQYMLCYGGMDGVHSFGDCFLLDLASLSWYQVDSYSAPAPRHKHAIATTSQNAQSGCNILISFGVDGNSNALRDCYMLSLREQEKTSMRTEPVSNTSGNLAEELRICYERIDFLSGKEKSLLRASLAELELLETCYLEGLQRISQMRKAKLLEEMKSKLAENSGTTPKETVERLQETVTCLQTENLKLKRKLRDHNLDFMDSSSATKQVVFGQVDTKEFYQTQGTGVPSSGAKAVFSFWQL